MSNEQNTTNKPRHRIVSSSNASGRARRFSCITYLKEEQLKKVLTYRRQQIRCYAYAYHDKDKKEDGTFKEEHCHLIIITHNTCSISAIRRWFSGYVDGNGPVTTTAQICSDVYTMYDYLTHNTVEARAEGKYQYDSSIVKVFDEQGYFQASAESEFDSITLALESLLKGTDVHTLCRRYGRDFILHYNAIKQVYSDISRYDKYGLTLDDLLQQEYELILSKLNGYDEVVKNEKR